MIRYAIQNHSPYSIAEPGFFYLILVPFIFSPFIYLIYMIPIAWFEATLSLIWMKDYTSHSFQPVVQTCSYLFKFFFFFSKIIILIKQSLLLFWVICKYNQTSTPLFISKKNIKQLIFVQDRNLNSTSYCSLKLKWSYLGVLSGCHHSVSSESI